MSGNGTLEEIKTQTNLQLAALNSSLTKLQGQASAVDRKLDELLAAIQAAQGAIAAKKETLATIEKAEAGFRGGFELSVANGLPGENPDTDPLAESDQ